MQDEDSFDISGTIFSEKCHHGVTPICNQNDKYRTFDGSCNNENETRVQFKYLYKNSN